MPCSDCAEACAFAGLMYGPSTKIIASMFRRLAPGSWPRTTPCSVPLRMCTRPAAFRQAAGTGDPGGAFGVGGGLRGGLNGFVGVGFAVLFAAVEAGVVDACVDVVEAVVRVVSVGGVDLLAWAPARLDPEGPLTPPPVAPDAGAAAPPDENRLAVFEACVLDPHAASPIVTQMTVVTRAKPRRALSSSGRCMAIWGHPKRALHAAA